MRKGNGQFVKGHKSVKLFKYTDEDILNEGAKYDSPTDFKNGNSKMYSNAVNRKLNKLIKYKKGFRITYHTDEDIINGGLRHDNPAEYSKNEPKLYSAAQKRGLLDQIKYKVGYIGNRVKRLVYVYEFSDNSVYVGLTYNDRKRELEHTITGKTSVSKHMRKTGLRPTKRILSDGYIDSDVAQKMEEDVRLEYQSNGWNILNKVKGGALGGTTLKWTEDVIRECVKQCSFIEDIGNKFGGAFIIAAKREGIYNEITKELPNRIPSYDKDFAFNVAKRYITIQEFKKDNPSLYIVVCRNKWNDYIFKHMINGKCDYILDTQTGIYYMGYQDVVNYTGINMKISGLRSQLTGRTKNKTRFILT
jgi:predicted GIY-YIG superfamily endonuclease